MGILEPLGAGSADWAFTNIKFTGSYLGPCAMSKAASPRTNKFQEDRKKKSVEETYQKLSQLEHVLKRPDTYVGSCEAQDQELWVFDSVQSRMVHRTIKYVPALYKI